MSGFEVHDPGGLGFRIDDIWAFLAVHEDGDEGVAAHGLSGMVVPLIAADKERLESLRPLARELAREWGKPIVLARFTVRIDEERYEP